jgi:hypothetical protein
MAMSILITKMLMMLKVPKRIVVSILQMKRMTLVMKDWTIIMMVQRILTPQKKNRIIIIIVQNLSVIMIMEMGW